jgi:hypothetical protein
VLSCTADTILFVYLYHIFNDNAIITACMALNKSLARPGRKQATEKEDFDVYYHNWRNISTIYIKQD